jgi:hypothetical protein
MSRATEVRHRRRGGKSQLFVLIGPIFLHTFRTSSFLFPRLSNRALPNLLQTAPLNSYPGILNIFDLLKNGSPDNVSWFEQLHIPDAFERSRQSPDFRLVQLHPTRFGL